MLTLCTIIYEIQRELVAFEHIEYHIAAIFFMLLYSLVFTAYIFTRSLKIQIAATADGIQKMTEGRLDFSIPHATFDEIGAMSAALNYLVGKLNASIVTVDGTIRNVMTAINADANSLAVFSEELEKSAESSAENAKEQAASIEEISASLEEMAASIVTNADCARSTDAVARSTFAQAEEGKTAIVATIEAMKRITEKISFIEEIAFQTNMLSINASIEAARAGEFGTGFAVVAEKVGRLAEKSQAAAKEINNLASGCVDIANTTGDIFNGMFPNIKKNADLVQEITRASEQQSEVVGQISNTMELLCTVNQANSVGAEELAESAKFLSESAQKLQEMIGRQRRELQEVVSFFQLGKGITG